MSATRKIKICYCPSDLIKRSKYEAQEMERKGILGGTYIIAIPSREAIQWEDEMQVMYVCPRCGKIKYYMEVVDWGSQ